MDDKIEIIRTKKRVVIPVDDNGIPIGQYHHRAKLSDAQVDQIRDWHEIGGFGYKKIVKMVKAEFGLTVHRITVREICIYLKRATTASSYRTRIVNLKPGETIKIKGIGTFRCPRVD